MALVLLNPGSADAKTLSGYAFGNQGNDLTRKIPGALIEFRDALTGKPVAVRVKTGVAIENRRDAFYAASELALIAEVWRATAIVFVILVAGLQLIPKEYGEAAEVFGATPWQRFVRVTLPLLRPSLQVALILRTILALEVFAVVVALGGRNLPVLAGEAYYWYSAYQNAGVAAAYAVLILGVSVLATFFYLRLVRTRTEAAP